MDRERNARFGQRRIPRREVDIGSVERDLAQQDGGERRQRRVHGKLCVTCPAATVDRECCERAGQPQRCVYIFECCRTVELQVAADGIRHTRANHCVAIDRAGVRNQRNFGQSMRCGAASVRELDPVDRAPVFSHVPIELSDANVLDRHFHRQRERYRQLHRRVGWRKVERELLGAETPDGDTARH